jgi:hypothetical protein
LVTFDSAPRFAAHIGTAVIPPASAAHRAASPDGPHKKHELASVAMNKYASSLGRYSALPPFKAWSVFRRSARQSEVGSAGSRFNFEFTNASATLGAI